MPNGCFDYFLTKESSCRVAMLHEINKEMAVLGYLSAFAALNV